MNIILLGAPGSGKGTQAENIRERLNIPVISTGAILREAAAERTESGLKAKEYMDRGELVPDEIVIGVIKERIAKPDCEAGFILDGFPRTMAQAEYIDEAGVRIDLVIDIYVSDGKITERMGGRRMCPSCGATYHLRHRPSHRGDICGRCESRLIIRNDDKPEVVLDRLKIYHSQTMPVKDFYSKKGVLKTVEGQDELSETTRLTMETLEEFIASAKK
ncbi:MAG: adenylate kinase [Oscillospiraceae bacterium]|nr:adenylate kinase [Oscillospiraceae bacterium]